MVSEEERRMVVRESGEEWKRMRKRVRDMLLTRFSGGR